MKRKVSLNLTLLILESAGRPVAGCIFIIVTAPPPTHQILTSKCIRKIGFLRFTTQQKLSNLSRTPLSSNVPPL